MTIMLCYSLTLPLKKNLIAERPHWFVINSLECSFLS